MKWRGILIGLLCACVGGAFAFFLATRMSGSEPGNATGNWISGVLFNGYTLPGVLLGENFLRLIGAHKHILPEGRPVTALLPVIALSFVFWSALLTTIVLKRSWNARLRIVLAVLSIFWLDFFGTYQMAVAGTGLATPGQPGFPFRSFKEDYFYLAPVMFFLLLFFSCFPAVSRRFPWWALTAAAGFALPAIVESYEIGNFRGIAACTLLVMAGLIYFLCRSRERGASPPIARD